MTILLLFKQTVVQFCCLFGPLIAGGLILTFVSRWTNNTHTQFVFPKASLFLFASIGTAVHEFSHAVFCRIFRHEIKKIKWFDPHAKGGAAGMVEHRFNPWNLYHRVGQFFIGLGPTLFGSFLLVLLFYILVPTGRSLIQLPEWHTSSYSYLSVSGVEILLRAVALRFTRALSQFQMYASLGFYIFIYIATCITSQMELSKEDLKQVSAGALPILFLLFCANLFAWSIGTNWHFALLSLASRLFVFSCAMFAFTIALSVLNLLLCLLIFNLINRLIGSRSINPFGVKRSAKIT